MQDALETIYIRVLRPSGPSYSIPELPGLPHPSEEIDNPAAAAAFTEKLKAVLHQHTRSLILAMVCVTDLFEHAKAIHVAKEIDPESKRTIGVVTKMHLVEKVRHYLFTGPPRIFTHSNTHIHTHTHTLTHTHTQPTHQDMDIVEKLQMTHRKDCILPLGYVAVRAGFEPKSASSWDQAIEGEKIFFMTNQLLKGLKVER
jgi:hypothetical protein